MTFASLKAELKDEIADANLSDTQLGNAINGAQQEIFNTYQVTLNTSSQTNSLVVDSNELVSDLPSDFQKIISIYITTPIPRDLTDYNITLRDFRLLYGTGTQSTGTPTYWTYFNSGLIFSTKSNQDHTVVIDYTKSVPILSASSDVPVVPEAFKEMLKSGAKAIIYKNKEDFDYAAQWKSSFKRLSDEFVRRYSAQQTKKTSVIKSSRQRV